MRELEGWQAYYALEPSFDQRVDWLFATVVQMVHNAAVGKKGQRPVKDFLLKFEEPSASTKQPWERQKAMMMLYLTGQKGQD